MNDALYELIVARKPKPYDLVIRILVILLIIAVAIGGMPFIGMTSFLLAVLIAILADYFIFPRLSVEYEYTLLNHDSGGGDNCSKAVSAAEFLSSVKDI